MPRTVIVSFLFIAFIMSSTVVHAQARIMDSKPFELGRSIVLKSAILREDRVLNIYLPPGYQPADSSRYPVIYLLDGAADEDFIHVVGLVQYFNFPWIQILPPSIVVGIANTDRKRDMTTVTAFPLLREKFPSSGGAAKFMAFIGEELKPAINRLYKTTDQSTLIGQSLAGLFATFLLFEHPGWFNNYIIISPSLWWNDRVLLSRKPAFLTTGFRQPTNIFISVGKEGPTPFFEQSTMESDATKLYDLLKNAAPKNGRFGFDYQHAETHATITHPALFNAFRWLHAGKPK